MSRLIAFLLCATGSGIIVAGAAVALVLVLLRAVGR